MARNKYPEVTLNRILDTALDLFIEKGYEQTTIQDIVDQLGDLSKGAIYHHFKSKEEIIGAVTEKMYKENNIFIKIKNDKSINGLEKIKRIFIESISSKQQQQLYRSSPALMKNPKFLSEQLNQSIYLYGPLLQEIIEEGVADGSLKVDHTKELAEMVMLMLNIWLNPGVFSATQEEFTKKIQFLRKLFYEVGLPVIDDDIIESLNDFYNALFI